MTAYTQQQQAIITHGAGSLLVLAGAGSGKTTTISARAGALVADNHCLADEHLMLTFSRKAASEMKLRSRAFIQESGSTVSVDHMPVDTYHAFGYRLLRDNPDIAGRKEGVTIQDDKDRKHVLRSIVTGWGLDYNHSPGRFNSWYGAYSFAKNYGFCADRTCSDRDALARLFGRMSQLRGEDPEQVLAFAEEYEKRLRVTNTLDFDDLCLWPARGLRDDPGLAQQYAQAYPFITVDEAQDTNVVQYEMVNAIAKQHGNLVLVGDDDQSIYGWRGARPENIRKFSEDYDPVTARLERNFRSTPAIVSAAGRHIAHNAGRQDKMPYAEGETGVPPSLSRHADGRGMAHHIAESIADGICNGTQPGEIAVLYRTNRMARVLEGALRTRAIPYTIVGGHSLYDAPEVKAGIAGVRTLINARDEEALWQLLPHLPGMGKKGLLTLLDEFEDSNDALIDIFGAGLKLGGKYAEMVEWLDDRFDTLKAWGPAHVGAWVLADEGLGYGRRMATRLANKSSPGLEHEIERRRSNLAAMDAATQAAIEARHLSVDSLHNGTIEDRFRVLLEAQISDPETSDTDERASHVVLSTAHRAKGLEWSSVHVAGYSDGLMPLKQRPDSSVSPERHMAEERRLSYVALTRAKTTCHLHHADQLRFPGDDSPTQYPPSPFVQEMGLEPPAARDNDALRVLHQESAPANSTIFEQVM